MGSSSTSEEFSWRSFASMVWVAMILPFTLGLFVLGVNASFWSPISWISGSLSQLFSLSTFGICVALQVVSVLSTFAHKRSVNVYKLPSGDGMKFILFLLRPNQLLSLIYFMACSLLFMLVLSTFSQKPHQQQSDSLIFFGLYSLFMGVFYGVDFYHREQYKLEFPVIQQKKLFRLKKILLPSLKESFYFTFKAMKMFVPMFFICAFLPQAIFSLLLNQETSETPLWTSISRYFDVPLFWSCYLMSWTTCFVLIASNKILHVFNTQALHFPIEATFVEEQGKTLSDGMVSANPVEKCLAFMDYSIVSRFEGVRRVKMFDLTIPGNQPHTWNRTSAECLQLLHKQRLQLVNECEKKEVTKRMYHANKAPPKTIGQQGLFSPSEQDSINTVPLASPTPAASPFDVKDMNSLGTATVMEPVLPVFQDLQIVVWAIEGLCNLIASSLYEDNYGVVQKNLPEILSELLQLLEACESFGKVSVLQNPLRSVQGEINKVQQETADAASLKIAVKNGIYTITSSFKYHVTSLRLSGEQKKKLHAFLEYDE